MAFGMSKPTTRRRELSDLPDDWVGWLEPGVEMEGKMKVIGRAHPAERPLQG